MRSIYFLWMMLIPIALFAQPKNIEIKDLAEWQQNEARPMVFFIHTDWCQYCKMMEEITFKNKRIEELLNNQFYFISFNAETKKDVMFLGKKYMYKPKGYRSGVHSLAEELGTINKHLNYPVLVVMDVNYNIVFQYSGYMNANELDFILKRLVNS